MGRVGIDLPYFRYENIRMCYGHPRSRSCGGLEGPFGPCWEPLSSVLCPLSSVSALHYHLVQYIVLLYSDPAICTTHLPGSSGFPRLCQNLLQSQSVSVEHHGRSGRKGEVGEVAENRSF